MALTKDDLNKIANLLDTRLELYDAKWEKRFSGLEIKFDIHEAENNRRFDVIEKKIDQLIKTENEDILMVYNDLKVVKTRLKKAGI